MKYTSKLPRKTPETKSIDMQLTEEMTLGLQGAMPSVLATVDDQGNPNVSYISQVYFVDDNHLAISNQFFNKSIRNIHSNGKATINIVRTDTLKSWYVKLKHEHTETEGELFDDMKMQLEAIASMSGMEDIFELKASEVFEVLSIEEAQTS